MTSKSKAFVAYIIIFLIGGASGYVLHDAVNPGMPFDRLERRAAIGPNFPPPMDPQVPKRMQKFLINRLDLNDDQIVPFFEAQTEHMSRVLDVSRSYRRSESDTLRTLYSDFIHQIDDILTEDQIERLNRFAHPDSVLRRRMTGHRPGRGD